MYLKLDIFDGKNTLRGGSRIELNWKQSTWVVDQDPRQVWERVSSYKRGSFQRKTWGVIWLLDPQKRCPVILQDAPQSEPDAQRHAGGARIFDPVDRAFKDATIRWKTDFTAVPPSNSQQPGSSQPGSLSPRRQHLLRRLKELLPCTYMSKNYKVLTGGAVNNGKTRTNCYMLPGFVAMELGTQGMTPKAKDAYMMKRSLNGMSMIRTQGLRYNAWVTADLVKRPLPGDVFGLLYWGKTDVTGDFSHVGVIESASGDEWRTADFGQGSGFDGIRDYKRTYDTKAGTLTGGGSVPRVLAGWVDIDKYFET